jgi:putative ABC transport system substrate-binding protein
MRRVLDWLCCEAVRRREVAVLLKRRTLLERLAGASLWPAFAAAQSTVPTIGIISVGSEALYRPLIAAMVARLKELGWVEGSNVRIEYRWAEGQNERVLAFAADFARAKVALIVTHSNGAVRLVAKAAPETPIVAASMGDPVKVGLAQSLAHPGGNITGSSIQVEDLAPKRIALLREIAPALRRLAVMGYSPGETLATEMESAKDYAAAIGLDVTVLPLTQSGDIAPAFESVKGRADGLFVASTPFAFINRAEIFRLALEARLPSVTGVKDYVASGALISYGVDFDDVWHRAGDAVDHILRGEKPANVPIQQSTKFELAVNLKTAKALDLAVPSAILAETDELVE